MPVVEAAKHETVNDRRSAISIGHSVSSNSLLKQNSMKIESGIHSENDNKIVKTEKKNKYILYIYRYTQTGILNEFLHCTR